MNTSKYTLEEIVRQKEKVEKDILIQKTIITGIVQDITTPLVQNTSKTNLLMRSFNTGMAVFDGVMVGIKIIKKLKNVFRHK